jgi:hypothetical protein
MTRKIILPPQAAKDEHGAYLPPSKPVVPEPEVDDISIDNLMGKGLLALSRLMKSVLVDITAKTYDRDTVMNLKDAMAMLKDLKKEERELLENLSDEELEKKLNP